MSSFVEIGQKFGRLTVIGFQPSKVVKGKSVLGSKTEIVKSLAYKYMQWLDKDVYFNLINNVKDFISK